MSTRIRRDHNAFEAVGFPPDEAEHLRIRADLMIELTRLIEKQGLTQGQAASDEHHPAVRPQLAQ